MISFKNYFLIAATASYRLLPDITLTRKVEDSEAPLLQSCFSPGVIGIDSNGRAYVKEARYDTCSRNVFRYDEIKDAVILSRIRDHFICKLESNLYLFVSIIFSYIIYLTHKFCFS